MLDNNCTMVPNPGTIVIGGTPHITLKNGVWPHFNGKPLPYLGCFTTPEGNTGMLYLDDTVVPSWEPANSANAVIMDNRNLPAWIELLPSMDQPTFHPKESSVLEFGQSEPNWIQGDEQPEGSTFLFDIPSNIIQGLNIGEGYGTVYVFDDTRGTPSMIWQS